MKIFKQFGLNMLVRAIVLGAALGIAAAPASAGPIAFDTFYQFSFTDVGVPARGCFPADPLGDFCTPSSGTPTQFLDAPPWTFLAPTSGVLLTVTDAFIAGDRFQIFDFGVSIGFTSLPSGSGDCGDDPVPCLADPSVSSGVFSLAGGLHSITIVPVLSPDGGGSGYLRASAIPEPATLLLFSAGLAALGAAKRRLKKGGD